MKSEDIDWKIIRGAIIIFTLTLALSGSLIFGGQYFKQQMQVEFNRSNASFRSISDRYLAVDEEEKLIREYLPEFVSQYQDGVIGDEKRLNWIEVLRKSGDDINVRGLSYRIESQKVFTPGFELTTGKFKIFSSKMSLSMQLLHEGDLFRILDKLENDANGTFSLTNCTIDPTGEVTVNDPSVSNVSAVCDLEWYTIKLASGETIEV